MGKSLLDKFSCRLFCLAWNAPMMFGSYQLNKNDKGTRLPKILCITINFLYFFSITVNIEKQKVIKHNVPKKICGKNVSSWLSKDFS